MIQNYMACSIQNYGSDAFRFTLRIRSVIHIHCTTPARKRKKKKKTTTNPYLLRVLDGAALRVETHHFARPSPSANKALLASSHYAVFQKDQYCQPLVRDLFTDQRL